MGAEVRFFLVEVFDIGAGAHHTRRDVAMHQPVGVSQFMNYYLQKPFGH